MKFLILGLILLVALVACGDITVEVPIRHDIERAVAVQGLENKFIHIQSRAGAGGLGAPIVSIGSSELFLAQVPLNEEVYVVFEYDKTSRGNDDVHGRSGAV